MINTFEDLKNHKGHKINCVTFQRGAEIGVALYCDTCHTPLINLCPGDLLSKELADDVGKTIAHAWSVEDVLQRAKERHINLSDQQCLEILQIIDHEKDATVGINWDTLDDATDDYLKDMSGG